MDGNITKNTKKKNENKQESLTAIASTDVMQFI